MNKKCKQKGCFEPTDCRHGYCAIHCHSGDHGIRDYSERKYPKTDDPHLGVEIEVEFNSRKDRNRALARSSGHHDGSLGEYSAEFKVLAPTKKAGSKCARLVHELWARRAHVSTACGIHVHIDVRGIPRYRIEQLFRWAWDTEEFWFTLVPPSRRNNGMVVKLPYKQVPTSHYTWIHLTEYNTVEIRLHGGSINPHKVKGWVEAMAYLQKRIWDTEYTFPQWKPQHTVPQEGETVSKRASLNEAKELFWSLFHDNRNLGVQYLNSRAECNGVLMDYAYQQLEEVSAE